jgi:predicted DNA-binding transcriptional regulator YafY
MSSRLERLISLDSAIRSSTYPGVDQLCSLFEVQPRTIYQDLKELREKFGLDIRFDREKKGYYNASPDKRLPSIPITDEELLLIMVASEMLFHEGGPSFRGGLANAVDNLLCERKGSLMLSIREKLSFNGTPDHISCSTFLTLLRASLNDKSVEITHTDPHTGAASVSKLAPIQIFRRPPWVLTGTLIDKGEEIRLPISSISTCQLLDGGDLN